MYIANNSKFSSLEADRDKNAQLVIPYCECIVSKIDNFNVGDLSSTIEHMKLCLYCAVSTCSRQSYSVGKNNNGYQKNMSLTDPD